MTTKYFDLQWLIDAAKTREQQAQLCLIFAMAAIADAIAPTDRLDERVIAYRQAVQDIQDKHEGTRDDSKH